MNAICKSIVLALLCFLLAPIWVHAQCKLPEEVRVIRVQLDEGNNSGHGGFLELQTMAVKGSNKSTVDLRNFIVDDNNEARYNVGTNPGHLILGDCFKDLPIGIGILIYDDNNLHPSIDPADDGWSADGQRLQVPFSDDCLIKMLSCPHPKDSRYCRETPGRTSWKDIFSFRTEGDVLQVRNRITEVVQAIQWGNSQFSDGNEDNTYSLADGECEFVGETIVVTYFEPVSIEVSLERLFGSSEYEIGVAIEGGLPPYKITTDQAYSAETSETHHQFSTDVYNTKLEVRVLAGNGCEDDETLTIPELEEGVEEICLGKSTFIGKQLEELPDGWSCYGWKCDGCDLETEGGESYEAVDPKETTLYTLFVSDDKGNIIGQYAYEVIVTPLEVKISPDVAMLCQIQEEPIEIEVVVAFEGDYTYLWSTGETSAKIFISEIGSYSVTVTDKSGCEGTQTISYQPRPALSIFKAGAENPTCPGTTQQLVIYPIDKNRERDMGQFNFQWSNGFVQDNRYDPSFIDVYYPGEYSVTITDEVHGCQLVEKYEVAYHDLPPSAPLNQETICNGEPVDLELYHEYDHYQWSTGSTASSIQVSEAGTYSVTVSSDFGEETCSLEGIEFEVVDQNLMANIKVNPGFFCEEEKVVLSVEHNATTPTYNWSNGSDRPEIEIRPDGIYAVTIMDEVSGCSTSAEIEIYNPIEAVSNLNILPEHPSFCPSVDQMLQLDNPPAWVAGLTWIAPDGNISDGNEFPITSAGTYELYIESIGGCNYFIPIEVEEGLDVEIEIDPIDGILCKTANNLKELDLIAQVSNGTGALTYNWSEGGNNTDRITISEVANYTVTVTDDLGCTGEAALAPPMCLEDDACFPLAACAIQGYSFDDMQAEATEYNDKTIFDYTGLCLDVGVRDELTAIINDAANGGISVRYIITSSSADIPLTDAQTRYDAFTIYDLVFWLHYDRETMEARMCMKVGDGIFGGPPVSLLRTDNSGFTPTQQKELKGYFVALVKTFFDCESGGYSNVKESLLGRFTQPETDKTNCTGLGCADCIDYCYNTWKPDEFLVGFRKQPLTEFYKFLTAEYASVGLSKYIKTLVNERKVQEDYWSDDGQTALYIHPFKAGVIDAILQNNPITGLFDTVKMLLMPGTWKLFAKLLSPIGRAELIAQMIEVAPELWGNLLEAGVDFYEKLCGRKGCDQMVHSHGYLVIGIGMFVADIAIGSHGAAPLSQLASKGVKNMIDVLSKWANDLAKLSPDVRGKFIRQLKTTFECATSVEIGNPEIYLRSSAGVCDELKAFFNHLFGEFGQDTRKLITDELSLLEVWKKYYKPGIEPKELEALLKRFPDQDDKFYEIFEQLFFEADGNGNFTLKDATAFDAFLEAMENVELAAVLTKEGGSGLRAWKVLFDDDALRVVTGNLEKIDNHLAKGIHLEDEMEAAFKAASDKAKWVDDIGYNVLRKANNKAEYINPTNNLLKWTDQHPNSINQSIQSALGQPPTSGKFYEGKVADYMQQQGKEIDGFGLQINNSTTGNIAGDVDVMDANNIIEVKKSFSSWSSKPDQVNKFVDSSLPNYLNPYSKNAILYIDEALTAAQKNNILSTIPSNVTLVNSLDELGAALQ